MLLSKNEVLRKVTEDGLSDKTKPRYRLAIFLKLTGLIQQMTQNQQLDDKLERQAHEFLKQRPPLVKAKSRFTATRKGGLRWNCFLNLCMCYGYVDCAWEVYLLLA
jgi:hypothetical protein